jgi:hypothetical protein
MTVVLAAAVIMAARAVAAVQNGLEASLVAAELSGAWMEVQVAAAAEKVAAARSAVVAVGGRVGAAEV